MTVSWTRQEPDRSRHLCLDSPSMPFSRHSEANRLASLPPNLLHRLRRLHGSTSASPRPLAAGSLRFVPALLIAALPLSLLAQSTAPPAAAASWADEIIKQESYAAPPKELADAVLAPRHLNVSLSSLSPDKKWFVDEIGDGPVLMKTFAKPFHELGGVFVDYKANRARALTIRNNVGIQLISAADGIEEVDPAAGGRAGLERDVVPRQQRHRVLRPRRRCDAHLVRRRRHAARRAS